MENNNNADQPSQMTQVAPTSEARIRTARPKSHSRVRNLSRSRSMQRKSLKSSLLKVHKRSTSRMGAGKKFAAKKARLMSRSRSRSSSSRGMRNNANTANNSASRMARQRGKKQRGPARKTVVRGVKKSIKLVRRRK